jgi:hypothetical protein
LPELGFKVRRFRYRLGFCQRRLFRGGLEFGEVLGEFLGRGVALIRFFREALENNAVEGRRESRILQSERARFFVDDFVYGLAGRFAEEWTLAGDGSWHPPRLKISERESSFAARACSGLM